MSKVKAFKIVAASAEEIWSLLKTVLFDNTNEICGKKTKRHH